MADDVKRKEALELIERNIAQHGQHIYVVSGGPEPRFAYTIGLSSRLGTELILAGAIFYMYDDVVSIINDIAVKVNPQTAWETVKLEVAPYGSFSLRKVHRSWVTALMLGALDFYQVKDLPAVQIVPDGEHLTIDVPNLSEPWSVSVAPAWQWLHEPWTYSVPKASVAVTNLAALHGVRVTEATRWEEDEWELFAGAGPDVVKEDMRVVPLGTLVATDASLEPVVNLRIGEGLWRDSDLEWHRWVKRN